MPDGKRRGGVSPSRMGWDQPFHSLLHSFKWLDRVGKSKASEVHLSNNLDETN